MRNLLHALNRMGVNDLKLIFLMMFLPIMAGLILTILVCKQLCLRSPRSPGAVLRVSPPQTSVTLEMTSLVSSSSPDSQTQGSPPPGECVVLTTDTG